MKINFEKLINESGEKITKLSLAQEMFKEGLFKSRKSAINMLNYHQNGKARGCDWELIKYLCKRFNKQGSEIIDWS
jgi:hypothetical protein